LNDDREQKKNYIPEFDFVGTELTSIDRGYIPGDRLQAVTFYDGKDTADLYIELASRGEKKWLKLPESQNFGKKINSFEYKLFGYEPTGCFKVDKVKANGVIDGMAFGVLL
jgi:hypothetical protein